ncbi:Na+-translocating ferredoxin:NAD+ oxidoreductase RnfD subunit [Actinomadura luteofluorescens]|uniref:Na+-translocating ferredoxin:NAD+ oxidoreductase RnfD subunit n=1 Tax=Actinomadura luteofluorescens TaxID=46163 RepID=A0A7Y9JKN0_9ACTN|nr:RnfABCDGE type electron transport complex subunit D [Actinomadura luteofluorescens]NYD52510.1 Na+-translocating ferredoxin:NAD+ oxidoreductase RnfD subunit [Actinomadura luteofluorescens]
MNSANAESTTGPAPAAPARPAKDPRIVALRRFAISITVFNILGHTVLGFEPSWATPLAAMAVAYVMELGLETLDAWATRRPVKYAGGPVAFVNFLMPAHITALACAMLLYANARLGPVVFAVIVAVASKYLVRVRIGGRPRHVLNPSNFGIAVVLVLFPWVGIAPPYQFTEWVGGPLDVAIPALILAAGTMLNAKLTGKMPLILGWVGVFALQALIRTPIEGTATLSALLAMTGVAFVLFTNYMITDPGTTPVRPRNQVVFGASTALVYALLVHLHVVYGLFFALVIVCVLRGAALAIMDVRQRATAGPAAPGSEPAAGPGSEPRSVPRPAPARGSVLATGEEAK